MKAKRIWIATHPTQPDNQEIQFTDPGSDGVWLYSNLHGEDNYYAEFKVYLLIELDE